jgi:hypothetical protein
MQIEKPSSACIAPRWGNPISIILLLFVLFEIGRSGFFREGDFQGYIIAGDLLLNGANIYDSYLNTWPPLFSVFAVPLSLINPHAPILLRVLWLLLSVLAYHHCFSIISQLLFDKKTKLPFLKSPTEAIGFQNLVVFIPYLLLYKYLLDNLSNIQINIFMLWLVLFSLLKLKQGKTLWAAFLLALTISLKVYTIFILFFFIFKRSYKYAGLTLSFVLLLNLVSFWVYGIETASSYYKYWFTAIAQGFPDMHHKNQSFQAMIWRFLSAEHTFDWKVNILNLSFAQAKRISYIIIAIASIYPAFVFRRTFNPVYQIADYLQIFISIALVAMFSPLSWKAYFIFLLPLVYLNFYLLFLCELTIKSIKFAKTIFFLSMVLFIFTSDLFVGTKLSDVFEMFGAVTLGSVLQILIALILQSKVLTKN